MSGMRKRVFILATVIFAAHVIAIFALHTPAPLVQLPDGYRSPRLQSHAQPTSHLIELEGLNDPLVFGGAHEHGFSADAWMTRPQFAYSLTNSPPAPKFLAFARSPVEIPSFDASAGVNTRSVLPFVELSLPKENRGSTLAIQGGLEDRQLLAMPSVPVQSATDVLSNTVVQVGVRADGLAFSARVITGSGSRAADLQALDIANRVRFAPVAAPFAKIAGEIIPPVPGGDLQWGELVFQWFTTEPTATNAASKASISAAK